jgi:D-aminoacyl-tRNA deacylase
VRALLQRVKEASVEIEKKVNGRIEDGLLVFIGIEEKDDEKDADWLIQKISTLRIFSDSTGKMNHSIQEMNYSFLVISQFTLHASTKKGNRPSYMKAALPAIATPLYDYFVQELKAKTQLVVETGIFGADMKVALLNDGPVTLFLDSKNKE